jgi:hypothetical protein
MCTRESKTKPIDTQQRRVRSIVDDESLKLIELPMMREEESTKDNEQRTMYTNNRFDRHHAGVINPCGHET